MSSGSTRGREAPRRAALRVRKPSLRSSLTAPAPAPAPHTAGACPARARSPTPARRRSYISREAPHFSRHFGGSSRASGPNPASRLRQARYSPPPRERSGARGAGLGRGCRLRPPAPPAPLHPGREVGCGGGHAPAPATRAESASDSAARRVQVRGGGGRLGRSGPGAGPGGPLDPTASVGGWAALRRGARPGVAGGWSPAGAEGRPSEDSREDNGEARRAQPCGPTVPGAGMLPRRIHLPPRASGSASMSAALVLRALGYWIGGGGY